MNTTTPAHSAFERFATLTLEAREGALANFSQFLQQKSRDKFQYAKIPQLRQAGLQCKALLKEALSSQEIPSRTRELLLRGIGYAQSVSLAKMAIEATARDPSSYIRLYALDAACSVKPAICRRELLDGLKNPERDMRIKCALYLNYFKNSRYRRQVRDALLKVALDPEEDEMVRHAALQSVAYYSGSCVKQALLHLRQEGSETIRKKVENLLSVRPHQLKRLRGRTRRILRDQRAPPATKG